MRWFMTILPRKEKQKTKKQKKKKRKGKKKKKEVTKARLCIAFYSQYFPVSGVLG